MPHYSTKTYGQERGLSAVFRQPNADHSHCSLLHGYSLGFRFVFGASELDNKNWVVDFGNLKALKAWLEDSFDHKTCITVDDPHRQDFYDLQDKGLCEVREFDGVGVEKFAEHAWRFADNLVSELTNDRCWCESVECSEHGANSAIYTPFTIRKERHGE